MSGINDKSIVKENVNAVVSKKVVKDDGIEQEEKIRVVDAESI